MSELSKMQRENSKKTENICCEYCGKIYKQKVPYYEKHLINVHGTNEKGDVLGKHTTTMCNKHFYTPHKLKQHLTVEHEQLWEFKCNQCDFRSESEDEYLLHLVTHSNRKKQSLFKCAKCDQRFVAQSALNNHKKITHQKKETGHKRVCPLCSFTTKARSKQGIYRHFQNIHKITLYWETFFFSSFKEFTVWKISLEQNTLTSYHKTPSKERTTIVYLCQRSNFRTPQQGEDSVLNKGISSSKASTFCPSQMKVFLNENSVVVSYLPMHIGHTVKLKFVQKSAKECEAPVGQMLHEGALNIVSSKNNGTNHIRHTTKQMFVQQRAKECEAPAGQTLHEGALNIVSSKNNGTNHIRHTTKQIRVQQNAKKCEAPASQTLNEGALNFVTSKNSRTSNNNSCNSKYAYFTFERKLMKKSSQHLCLERFVTGYLSKLNDTEVCIYKAEGTCNEVLPSLKEEDFLLVYMTKDQHHMLTTYSSGTVSVDNISGKDYTMFTMSVRNHFNEGIPVAFMFTNKVDCNTLTIFFESVKQKNGTISCENFLSDVAELISSVWENVMGAPQHRILSTWHVFRYWRTHFNRLVKNKEKREMMYNALQSLVREVDEDSFYNQLKSFLVSDEESQELLELFHKEFVVGKRVKVWAHCYGLNANLNREMSLENLYTLIGWDEVKDYKVAVTLYLRRIIGQKLHLHSVMTFMKQGQRKKSVRENHSKSKSLNIAMVKPLGNTSMWKVVSYDDDDFVVVEQRGNCKYCELGCNLCNACYHKYLCSCSDYAMKISMCVHIHLVAQYLSTGFAALSADEQDSPGDSVLNVDGNTEYTMSNNMCENVHLVAQYLSTGFTALSADEQDSPGDSVMNVHKNNDALIHQQSDLESTVLKETRDNNVREQRFDETRFFDSPATEVCALPWERDGSVSTTCASEEHKETSCSDVDLEDFIKSFGLVEKDIFIEYLEEQLHEIEVNEILQQKGPSCDD